MQANSNVKYRFEAKLSSQLGVLPSYTALGMAKLLIAAADFFELKNQWPQVFQYDDANAMYEAYETKLFRFDQLYRHFCSVVHSSIKSLDPEDFEVNIETPYAGVKGTTIFYWLLPYLEERAVYDCARKSGAIVEEKDTKKVVGVCTAKIATYLCPSDSSHEAGLPKTFCGGAFKGWASGCYAANYLVFGAPEIKEVPNAKWLEGISKPCFT